MQAKTYHKNSKSYKRLQRIQSSVADGPLPLFTKEEYLNPPHKIYLSDADWGQLMASLEDDSPPNENLRKALASYRSAT